MKKIYFMPFVKSPNNFLFSIRFRNAVCYRILMFRFKIYLHEFIDVLSV